MLPNPNYKSSLVLEHAGFVEFGLAREGKQVVNEMSKCMRMVDRVQTNYSRMSVFFPQRHCCLLCSAELHDST